MYNIKNCSIPDHFYKHPETGYCLECIELLAAKVQEEYSAKDEIFVLARQFKYPEALVIADKAIQFFSQAEEIYFDLGDDLRNRKKQNEAIENCYYEGRLLAGVLANLLEQKCIILTQCIVLTLKRKQSGNQKRLNERLTTLFLKLRLYLTFSYFYRRSTSLICQFLFIILIN